MDWATWLAASAQPAIPGLPEPADEPAEEGTGATDQQEGEQREVGRESGLACRSPSGSSRSTSPPTSDEEMGEAQPTAAAAANAARAAAAVADLAAMVDGAPEWRDAELGRGAAQERHLPPTMGAELQDGGADHL